MAWGMTRCYAVRTVEIIDALSVESEATEPACVTLVDTFPPAAPKGLNTVASGEVFDREDPRLERHDRLEAQIRTGRIRERRGAVQHDAGPHPVGLRIRPGDQAGGIGDAAFARHAARYLVEQVDLRAGSGVATLFGFGQVRDEVRGTGNLRTGSEPGGRSRHFGRPETEASHSSVDLEPDAESMRAAPGFQQPDLGGLVHERFKAELRRLRELARIGDALEQYDAGATARRAQHDRLLQARNCEGVRASERLRRSHDTVAIGIGLDDREDAAAGGEFTDPREIVLEGRGVDDRAQRRAQNAPSP
jgi:hypothetical protein